MPLIDVPAPCTTSVVSSTVLQLLVHLCIPVAGQLASWSLQYGGLWLLVLRTRFREDFVLLRGLLAASLRLVLCRGRGCAVRAGFRGLARVVLNSRLRRGVCGWVGGKGEVEGVVGGCVGVDGKGERTKV